MKDGIPYFPLDCELDDKFELIEAEFGLTGFAIVVKLLQRIYGGEGYYCEWTNEVALLFAKRNSTGGSVVSEIVEASVKRGIFDQNMFEKYRILTSKGIQERYLKAVDRRKQVEVKNQYLLVQCDNICKNVHIIKEDVNIYKENANILKQRKEEKSKEEESKEKNKTISFAEFWFLYPKKIAKTNAEKAWQKIKPDESLFAVIKKSLETLNQSEAWTKDNGKFIPYAATWLNGRRWEDELIVEKKPKKETTYDLDEFEKMELKDFI